MRTGMTQALLAISLFSAGAAQAFELVPERVADNVYALIGPTEARTYENQALNNNLGFVVTGEGVVLIDSGASAQGAALVEAAVRRVTDRPIRYVINTGSQDHRWLGNGYFAAKGATVVALARTVATQREFADQHMQRMQGVLKDRLAGTAPAYAREPVAADAHTLNVGGVTFELRWLGDAHFPGDAVVWLPQQRVLFSGDLVYVDRMLAVHPWSRVKSWAETFQSMTALQPQVIVPGHGRVCDLAQAQRETGDYLDWLVREVSAGLEQWEPLGELTDRLSDAPAFAHLRHYDSWHRSNINRTYLQLEGQ